MAAEVAAIGLLSEDWQAAGPEEDSTPFWLCLLNGDGDAVFSLVKDMSSDFDEKGERDTNFRRLNRCIAQSSPIC